MRLGRVEINFGYTVNLDDEEMVEQAKDSLYEDIMDSCENDEIGRHLVVRPNQVTEYSTTLSEGGIPEFLREDALARKEESDG